MGRNVPYSEILTAEKKTGLFDAFKGGMTMATKKGGGRYVSCVLVKVVDKGVSVLPDIKNPPDNRRIFRCSADYRTNWQTQKAA